MSYRYVVRIDDTDYQYEEMASAISRAKAKYEQLCDERPDAEIRLLRENIETGREEILV